MNNAEFPNAEFVERQRRRLVDLRAALLAVAHTQENEESQVNQELAGNPLERGDDGQKLAALELAGNLVVHDVARLARVNRALEKIAAGTYGISDVSGAPIPRERLEAVPEAVCTLEEESEYERQLARQIEP
jgi:DnaK suppressor protein